MKRINILLLLSLFLSLVSATTVPVSIVEYQFIPDTAQVVQGDTIVWTNNGAFLHTSTSGINGVWDSIWDSGTLNPSQSYSRAFVDVGNFSYFCRFHYLLGMHGLVQVRSAGIDNDVCSAVEPAKELENYPNPFRIATQITYSLNLPGRASLRIYSASGELVKTTVREQAAPGKYSIVWDGKDDKNQKVANGVYFCHLNSDNMEVMKKLLRLK
jgi:plastocyanin